MSFKLVYSNWVEYNNVKYPIANGLHPATVDYIKRLFQDSKASIDTYTLKITEIDRQFPDQSKGVVFRHTDFMLHFLNHFSKDYLISEEEINDNSTYFYPIEVEAGVEKLLNQQKSLTFNLNDLNYEYVFKDTLSPQILAGLQTGKIKLVLVNMADPLMEDTEICSLEEAMSNIGIDGQNIIFLQGNIRRRHGKVQMVSSILSLVQNANLLDRYPLTDGLGNTSDVVKEKDLDQTRIRDKKFICFNRFMNRSHRVALCYLAVKHNLLDQGYFSFITKLHGDSLRLLKEIFNDNNIVEIDKKIKNLIPYEIDTQHLEGDQKQWFYPIDNNNKELYLNSYIHITSETQFLKHATPFFSEKTWRPIMNLQPFIFVGNPGSLEKLRELGFKTFHPFINESYDLIADDRRRFLALEQEIKKFSEMSVKEIHSWYYFILNTLIHNRDHLRTFKDYNPTQDLFTQQF